MVTDLARRFRKISPGYSNQALSFYYVYLTFLCKTFRKPFKEHALVEMSIYLLFLYRSNYYNVGIDVILNFDKYYLNLF